MHDIHVNKLGFHMIFCIALKLVVSKYIVIQATKKIMCRAANNGRSTDNVQSNWSLTGQILGLPDILSGPLPICSEKF